MYVIHIKHAVMIEELGSYGESVARSFLPISHDDFLKATHTRTSFLLIINSFLFLTLLSNRIAAIPV